MTPRLIKNATIINADSRQHADILIVDGKIVEIGQQLHTHLYSEIIDASGKLIMPGGIDPHVHFHLKTPFGYSADDFLSGSKAALKGGTTTIMDFVTPEKNQSLVDALKQRLVEAEKCLCNYQLHVSPINYNQKVAAQMETCVFDYGIKSFKVYMSYTDSIGLNNDKLKLVLQKAALLKAVVLIHAENDGMIQDLKSGFLNQGNTSPKYHALSRPAQVEFTAVKQAIALARETGTPIYFVHISAQESVQAIAHAQNEGLPVYAETCPHYLLFDDTKLTDDFESSAPFVFSPALHGAEHKSGLWQGLAKQILQTIGTDHCPFNFHQKRIGHNNFTKIPNGVGGVEYRLELLHHYGVNTGRISLEHLVAITSSNAAKIFGLSTKGKIAVGYDADMVIFNPNKKWIISADDQQQQCDINIYQGMQLQGKVDRVMLNGIFV